MGNKNTTITDAKFYFNDAPVEIGEVSEMKYAEVPDFQPFISSFRTLELTGEIRIYDFKTEVALFGFWNAVTFRFKRKLRKIFNKRRSRK